MYMVTKHENLGHHQRNHEHNVQELNWLLDEFWLRQNDTRQILTLRFVA